MQQTGLSVNILTLTSGEGTDHDQPGAHTGEQTRGAELTGHLDESRGGRLSGSTLGLVDLGQQGVGGLRDDGGGHTGDETGREVETHLLTTGERVLGSAGSLEDLLGSDLEAGLMSIRTCLLARPRKNNLHGELGHGVGDLLEQDGTETGVEGTGTLLPQDSEETARETGSERGLRDETDSGGLKGTQGNVGEELGNGGSSEVDGLSVVSGSVDTEVVDGLLLPELVTGVSVRLPQFELAEG